MERYDWMKKRWIPFVFALIVLPAFNAVLNILVLLTPIPLFLDSIGTTVSAALFGLPLGMATAILTNFYQEALYGFPWRHLPFALCGMATVAIVWAMVRRKTFSSPIHFILATLLIALANSILGAIIAVFVYGGGTGTNIDFVVAGFSLAFENILSAAFFARIVVNIVDKAPAVLAAMVLYRVIAEPLLQPVHSKNEF